MATEVKAWKDSRGILHETELAAKVADATLEFDTVLAEIDGLMSPRCGSELRRDLQKWIRGETAGRLLRRLHEANVARNAAWGDGRDGDAEAW